MLRPSATARICICSQAPGVRVHASGTPFTDPSGDRLRAWLELSAEEFYDQRRIAIVPMGFCFPGHDAAGGDLPPRRECARAWHERLFAAMPQLELILAVGSYAQRWHLGDAATGSMTDTVKRWRDAARCARHGRGSCPCRIPPGATTPGSPPTRGSSASCCRACGARSASC